MEITEWEKKPLILLILQHVCEYRWHVAKRISDTYLNLYAFFSNKIKRKYEFVYREADKPWRISEKDVVLTWKVENMIQWEAEGTFFSQ